MMLAWTLARRELRGSLASFRVFLACLAIGVAAIAAVGSITSAINAGLAANGRALLGGDVEVRLTHRFADADERAWLEAEAQALSEVVSFRGMIGAPGGERALAQIKGVDAVYPLVGAVELAEGEIDAALAERDGLFGAVVEQTMMDRLDLSLGDRLRLGTKDVALRGVITGEPDRQASGIGLGPRVMVARAALEGAGLLQAGSLYRVSYRLTLAEGDTAETLRERLDNAFPDAGWRWRDLSDPSPGTARIVERIGTFLVLVGLASLAVGGVGVSAATRGYLDRKTETIGTLKALGASGGLTVSVYLIQIMLLTALGIAIGLVIGAGVPMLLASTLREALPVPADFGVYPGALFEAAAYGAMTALLFALWPLAMARETPAAVLFRDVVGEGRRWPRPAYLVVLLALFAALVGAAVLFSGNVLLGGFFIGGLVVALVAFALVAQVVRWIARWLGRRPGVTRGRPALRLALSAIGGPGSETTGVMLSLGLGLTLLSTIGQIDANLRSLIAGDISEEAPAFFYLDIPAPQKEAFVAAAQADSAIDKIDTAPMLRGRIVKINGAVADPEKIAPEARWMLRGDRGLTYSALPPEGTTLTEGTWWAEDYTGEPLVSFIEEEGRQMGLNVGDTITVNVLGRDLTTRIANFREVEWRRMGINFTLVVNPAALQAAPHSHIATLYAAEGEEGRLTRMFAEDFPSAVAIPVRDVIARTKVLIGQLADAVRGASLATILSGLIVLIGVTAAAQRRHLFEAAVLKTLGAERGTLMRAAVLRYLFLGSAAAVLAIGIGSVAAWAVMTKLFETEFSFAFGSALIVGALGVLATLLTCGYFARRMVNVMPARMLRSRE